MSKDLQKTNKRKESFEVFLENYYKENKYRKLKNFKSCILYRIQHRI